jgi:hypothetical protein
MVDDDNDKKEGILDVDDNKCFRYMEWCVQLGLVMEHQGYNVIGSQIQLPAEEEPESTTINHLEPTGNCMYHLL